MRAVTHHMTTPSAAATARRASAAPLSQAANWVSEYGWAVATLSPPAMSGKVLDDKKAIITNAGERWTEVRDKFTGIEQKLLETILPEVYAVVKNAARRLTGQTVTVTDQPIVWNMVHFDVQLIGGIALHRGMDLRKWRPAKNPEVGPGSFQGVGQAGSASPRLTHAPAKFGKQPSVACEGRLFQRALVAGVAGEQHGHHIEKRRHLIPQVGPNGVGSFDRRRVHEHRSKHRASHRRKGRHKPCDPDETCCLHEHQQHRRTHEPSQRGNREQGDVLVERAADDRELSARRHQAWVKVSCRDHGGEQPLKSWGRSEQLRTGLSAQHKRCNERPASAASTQVRNHPVEPRRRLQQSADDQENPSNRHSGERHERADGAHLASPVMNRLGRGKAPSRCTRMINAA